jgi:hypothetical protein
MSVLYLAMYVKYAISLAVTPVTEQLYHFLLTTVLTEYARFKATNIKEAEKRVSV